MSDKERRDSYSTTPKNHPEGSPGPSMSSDYNFDGAFGAGTQNAFSSPKDSDYLNDLNFNINI